MPLHTIEPRRLYRQIADQLRTLIAAGEFAPGSRLPPDRDLAVQLGVSRPSVRDAVIALEVEGLVEVRMGSGIYVTALAVMSAVVPREVGSALGPFEIIRARQLIESELEAVAARQTHKFITTEKLTNKFGIDFSAAEKILAQRHRFSHIRIKGLHIHIGSQITDIKPFLEALRKIKELVHTLREQGIPVRYIDIGGGLGITYDQEQPPHPREYAAALMDEMRGLSCTLILEPGRVIAGNAGILVTRVLYIKEGTEKTFVTVDAAMNDLIRPSLYGAFQAIQPVTKAAGGEMVADVVGPICESGDFFARERTLPRVKPDDLLAIMSAGAYGFTMYLLPRPVESHQQHQGLCAGPSDPRQRPDFRGPVDLPELGR